THHQTGANCIFRTLLGQLTRNPCELTIELKQSGVSAVASASWLSLRSGTPETFLACNPAYSDDIFVFIDHQVKISLTKSCAAILAAALVGDCRPGEFPKLIANSADIVRWHRLGFAHVPELSCLPTGLR